MAELGKILPYLCHEERRHNRIKQLPRVLGLAKFPIRNYKHTKRHRSSIEGLNKKIFFIPPNLIQESTTRAQLNL